MSAVGVCATLGKRRDFPKNNLQQKYSLTVMLSHKRQSAELKRD